MKCALVFAVAVCAMSCLQLVAADTTGRVFKRPEIAAIASRLDQSIKKLRTTMMQNFKVVTSDRGIKEGLFTYDNFVKAVINAKPECDSGDMANLSSNANTAFRACLPDQAELNVRMQEGEKAIGAVFDNLTAVDETLQFVSDGVLRAEKAAEADANIVGEFYLRIMDHIFSSAAPIQQCIQKAATSLRDTVLGNIKSITTCYTS